VILGAVVDWDALVEVVVASLVGTIGVTLTFSLAIYGATRFTESRRKEVDAGALPYAALAVAGLAVTAAAVVLGLVVMVSK
jgi:uncharacterized membrane protein